MLLGLSGQKIILLVFPWPLPKQLQLQSGSRGLKYAVMLWGMRKNDWIHTSGISCNQASQNLANYWICDEFQSFLPKIWATPLGALLKRNKGEGEKRFAAFLCAIVCIFGWFGVQSTNFALKRSWIDKIWKLPAESWVLWSQSIFLILLYDYWCANSDRELYPSYILVRETLLHHKIWQLRPLLDALCRFSAPASRKPHLNSLGQIHIHIRLSAQKKLDPNPNASCRYDLC